MSRKYIALDNGGETYDRYTIIERKTGDMIGASDEPFHPVGFGQFCGNVADNYWNVAYGYSWRKGCDETLLKKRIKFALDTFLADCVNVGRQIDFSTLPLDVQKFTKQRFTI